MCLMEQFFHSVEYPIMKNKTSKVSIYKRYKDKLINSKCVQKCANKLVKRQLKKTSELLAGYQKEIKEYLVNYFEDNPQFLSNELDIKVLKLGTSIEDGESTILSNLTGNKKVLLIELSVLEPELQFQYTNILWQVRFNLIYRTEQVKVNSFKDKIEKHMDPVKKHMYQVKKHMDQIDMLLPALSKLKKKSMKNGKMTKDNIELTSIRTCTIPESNSSKALKSTIYKGNVNLRKRYQAWWWAFERFMNRLLLRLLKFLGALLFI